MVSRSAERNRNRGPVAALILRASIGGLAAAAVVFLFGQQPPAVSFLVGFAVAFLVRPRKRQNESPSE
jgi:hypothetical protein